MRARRARRAEDRPAPWRDPGRPFPQASSSGYFYPPPRRSRQHGNAVEHHPLDAAFAALLANGLDGAGEALRILVNEASKIERTHFLNAQLHERTTERADYANGFKPKSVMTRVGELTFAVPQVRNGGFYPSALEKGTRTEQALNIALAEMYVQGVSTRKVRLPTSW